MHVLAVDDEPLARSALERYLSERVDVESVEVADDARQALGKLQARSYDVLLLDVRMPELSGLQLLERWTKQSGKTPAVIFITAHPEYAVEAFEKRAVDYVLKPFVPERLHAALDTAIRRSTQERAEGLVALMRELHVTAERPTRIAVKDKGRIVIVDTSELISAEAHGNYVLLQKKSGSYLLRDTMSAVAARLMPYGFIRIHRSVVINPAHVETIQLGVGSECVLRTKNGKQYSVTRSYRENLRALAQFWT